MSLLEQINDDDDDDDECEFHVGSGGGRCVLRLRGPCHRASNSDHRQQLRRILQGPDAAREGAQAAGGDRASEAQRKYHLVLR